MNIKNIYNYTMRSGMSSSEREVCGSSCNSYTNLRNYSSTGYDRYASHAPVAKLHDPHYTVAMQERAPPPSSPPGSYSGSHVTPHYGGLGYNRGYDALVGDGNGSHHTLRSGYMGMGHSAMSGDGYGPHYDPYHGQVGSSYGGSMQSHPSHVVRNCS